MRRQYVGNLLLLLGSIVVGLFAAELAVRLIWGAPMPEKLPLVRVKADPQLGWVMLPKDIHYSYEIEVRLNSLGFRGTEVEPKSENEYRILAIGDSHVYGQGLADGDLLTTKLEMKLNRRGERCRYRVINMGVRAYSLNQEYSLLNKTGLPLDPDHVVLFFYINDFRPVNIERRYQRYKEMEWYMFDLSARPDEEVVRKWNRTQLLRRSALLMLTYDLYRGFTSGESTEQLLLSGQSTADTEQRIGEVKDYLDKIQALAAERGFRLTVVAIPVRSQIDRPQATERYQSVVQAHLDERGVEFLDLLPSFQSYYRENKRVPVLPFDGHYDAEGHEVMASAIAEDHLRCPI